ncbi:hypothetical protein TrCOL_g4157, partial [Triparma columacea]
MASMALLVTGESQWLPDDQDEGEDDSSDEESALPAKAHAANLPEGWQEKYTESGAAYYYNIHTGEQTWEKPTSELSVSIDAANPWEERYDESSQAVYYFNKMTGESVWEKPANYDELVAASAVSLTMESIAAPATPTGSPLRTRKLEEREDPASGYLYFFNNQTQESVWEKPADFDDELEAYEEVKAPTAEEGAASTTTAAPAPAVIWEKKTTDEGYEYFFNSLTGESVWEQPEGYVDPNTAVNQPSSTTSAATTSPWEVRFTDEGYEYYFNTMTHESAWEKPADFDAPAAEEGTPDQGTAQASASSAPRMHLQFSTLGMFASVKLFDRPWQRKWVQVKFTSASNTYELTATNAPTSSSPSLTVSDYEKLAFSLSTITTLVKSATLPTLQVIRAGDSPNTIHPLTIVFPSVPDMDNFIDAVALRNSTSTPYNTITVTFGEVLDITEDDVAALQVLTVQELQEDELALQAHSEELSLMLGNMRNISRAHGKGLVVDNDYEDDEDGADEDDEEDDNDGEDGDEDDEDFLSPNV